MVVPDPSMAMSPMHRDTPQVVQEIQQNLRLPHSKIPRVITKSFVEFNPTDPNSDLVSIYQVNHERMIMAPSGSIFNDFEIFLQYIDLPPKTEQERQRWVARLNDLDNIDQELGWAEEALMKLIGNVAGTGRSSPQANRSFAMKRLHVNELRKSLYLMVSLWNKDRKNHLLKKDPNFRVANQRMKEWKRAYNLGRTKDVWVHNMVNILNARHNFMVRDMPEICDLEKHDFHSNVRERFMVFWEAGANDEFVLTDNAFGGFEETELGGDPAVTVSITPEALAEKFYSKDHAWHQLFVLTPKLCLALCHGSYIDESIRLEHEKRWGLKPSILDSLPHRFHDITFRDLTTAETSFLPKDPAFIQKVTTRFGVPNGYDGKVMALEMKDNDELIFEIQPLSSKQVHLVNSVLLQNQVGMTPVTEVCSRLRAAGQCLADSVQAYHNTEWAGRTSQAIRNYSRLSEYGRPPSKPQKMRRNTNPLMPLGPMGPMDDGMSPPPTPSGFPTMRPSPNPMQSMPSSSSRYPLTPPMVDGSHSTETVSTRQSERARRQQLPPVIPVIDGRQVPAAAPPIQHHRVHPPHPQHPQHPHHPQQQPHPQQEQRPRSTRNNTLQHTPPTYPAPPSQKAQSEKSYESNKPQETIESLENDLEEAQSRKYHASCLKDPQQREAGMRAAEEEIRVIQEKRDRALSVQVSDQEAEKEAARQREELAYQNEIRARKLKEGELRQQQIRNEQLEQERMEKLRKEQEARAEFEEKMRCEELKRQEEEQRAKAERQRLQAIADAEEARLKEQVEAARKLVAQEEENKRKQLELEQAAERERAREQARQEAEKREKLVAAMAAEKARKEEAIRREEQRKARDLEAEQRLAALRQVESTRTTHQVVHATRGTVGQSTSDLDPQERLRKLRSEEQARVNAKPASTSSDTVRKSHYRPPSVEDSQSTIGARPEPYRPNIHHPLPAIPVDQSEVSTVVDEDAITMISDSSSKASKVSSNKSELNRVPSSKTSCSEHSDGEENSTVRDLPNMTGRIMNAGSLKPQGGRYQPAPDMFSTLEGASMVAQYDDEESSEAEDDQWEDERKQLPVMETRGPMQYGYGPGIRAPLGPVRQPPLRPTGPLQPSPHIQPGRVPTRSHRAPPVGHPARGRY